MIRLTFPPLARIISVFGKRLCDGEMRLSFPCTPAFTPADYLGVKEQESRSEIPNYSQACNFLLKTSLLLALMTAGSTRPWNRNPLTQFVSVKGKIRDRLRSAIVPDSRSSEIVIEITARFRLRE